MEITIANGKPAPDLSIPDWEGKDFTLSSYRGKKSLFLVFNRGFL